MSNYKIGLLGNFRLMDGLLSVKYAFFYVLHHKADT